MKTGIYVRVSTEEQVLNGYSIRAQEEKLVYYCEQIKNWKIYKIYSDEGISGKNIKERPGLQELIDDVNNKIINNVLVFKIDRLTRSTRDLIDLIEIFNKNKCEFNSLNESIDTSTATGRMFIKIIGIFAEFERENIIERITLGIDRKVKEGYSLCSSTPPYGYDRPNGCKTLIINEIESVYVKKIYKMYLNGNSITEIVNYFNKNNIKTKKNKKWTYKTIKLILTNSTYIGKVRHRIQNDNYFETNGYHKPIINITTYKKVQKKILNKQYKYTDAYYSHILRCKCGNDMIPKRVYRNNKMYINYRCKNKTFNCTKDISHNKLETMVNKSIKGWNQKNIKQKNIYLNKKKVTIELINNNSSIIVTYN